MGKRVIRNELLCFYVLGWRIFEQRSIHDITHIHVGSFLFVQNQYTYMLRQHDWWSIFHLLRARTALHFQSLWKYCGFNFTKCGNISYKNVQWKLRYVVENICCLPKAVLKTVCYFILLYKGCSQKWITL